MPTLVESGSVFFNSNLIRTAILSDARVVLQLPYPRAAANHDQRSVRHMSEILSDPKKIIQRRQI